MLQFLLILMLNISPVTRTEKLFVASDSLFNKNGILNLGIRDGWRFQPGDDLNWADPYFNDSVWMFYKPAGLTEPIPDTLWNGYGWFRYRFAADSSAYEMATHLYFLTWGAAEVYLDGKLIRKYGVFSTYPQGEKRFMPYNKTFPALVMQHDGSHVLAIRFSYHKGQQYKKLLGKYAGTFGFDIGLATDHYSKRLISRNNMSTRQFYILSTMMFLIVLLHLFIFVLFPAERSNLYIAIVAFLLFLHIIVSHGTLFFEFDVMQYLLFRHIPYIILFMAALSAFPLTINFMFNQQPHREHRMLIWLFPVFAVANFIFSGPNFNLIVVLVFASSVVFLSSRVLIKAWRNNQKGVWFVAGGFLGLIISAVTWVFYVKYSQNFRYEINSLLTSFIYAAVPLGLSAFMASRFRDLNTNLEQKVKERTLELQQSLEELRSTQTQLIHSEKMASLGALTAGIAHEIQNPLNFVNNFSEVSNEMILELLSKKEKARLDVETGQGKSERDETSEDEILNDISKNLEKILHNGKRADAIVKGMLQHSRTNTGQKEAVNVNTLAGEYLRLSYHGMRAKDNGFNADLKTDFDPDLPKITAVPQDIGRVLLNLINNAFYAVDQRNRSTVAEQQRNRTVLNDQDQNPSSSDSETYKPVVTVSTKNLGQRIEISVRDNGDGIPEEIKDKIFQPFFTTKPAGQGTGLGLSLAYDIVKAHGGELKVETREGEGTRFTIALPVL